MTWAKSKTKRATWGRNPQSGPGQNHQREGLTLYQHDIELTARFAIENSGIMAEAREKLTLFCGMYRCENHHIFCPGKNLGPFTKCPVCGGNMHLEV